MKVTSASVDFPAALAVVREGGSLDAGTSARVFEIIMSGAVAEADLIAFLTAQAMRGPTVAEIVGAVRDVEVVVGFVLIIEVVSISAVAIAQSGSELREGDGRQTGFALA